MFAGALQQLLQANSSALLQPSSVYLPPAIVKPFCAVPLCTPCAIAQQQHTAAAAPVVTSGVILEMCWFHAHA